jgi:chitinase
MFVSSAIQLLEDNGLDGIDIDFGTIVCFDIAFKKGD